MNGLQAAVTALAEPIRDGARALGCDLLVCPPATVRAAVAVDADVDAGSVEWPCSERSTRGGMTESIEPRF